MADAQTRFGIVGCADIARKVSRAILLSPSSTLAAVASRSLVKAKAFAAENGLPDSVRVYGSYEQLLDDPCVDTVYMPLPTGLHLHWAVAAARKKKHLLLEKPPALDVAELDLILEACESGGVQFMDGSMWLHHPRTARMKEMISDPHLFGRVNNVSVSYYLQQQFILHSLEVLFQFYALGSLSNLDLDLSVNI
uniref:Gfo/Idh/MocA-like oxidoreductase N-terminal domain-containing protein n=1 Tax=Kalanchoe fedtschenkoi TaxID=63787 RepID=A0A7N0TBV1_KALFE